MAPPLPALSFANALHSPHMTAAPSSLPLPLTSTAQVREALIAKREIALLDVREEDPFARAHPLFAANLPAGRIEVDAWARIPRRSTLLVVYDDGEGLAEPAARKLQQLGYTQVTLLQGGLQGWKDAGGEIFIDVNVPSKSFGELVESERHTPSLTAQQVQALLDERADVVVLDARRFDEYQTMSIPSGISVPGAELVLRAQTLAPRPSTQIIVNCAGRTRSIIGTQSLVNAGLPNRVAALRNGTIGWLLAGQQLDHGAQRSGGALTEPLPPDRLAQAAARARSVADRAGVQRATSTELVRFAQEDPTRTTYRFDVRTPGEYEAGHLPGFRSAPGGQLVQETDHSAPVRGARIVLADDDGVRANMTASWLAQMGWDVWVLDGARAADFAQAGQPAVRTPEPPDTVAWVSPQQLHEWLAQSPPGHTVVLDLATSAEYVKRHIPGAFWVLRSQLAQAVAAIAPAKRYVLTCGSGLLARYAAAELARLTGQAVAVLEGGTPAWAAQGFAVQTDDAQLLSPRIDRYRRPYEGTSAPREAMQAYLDWEYGLVEQLARDATHGFRVL
ncbi:MAG: rhodanese-related sulfurtransferase [Comamonadaceae bacterium]|nr:MAG: rhodanese-related sulfurtransferase [Comamonadaceae bacterium]